jgi:hypothetical protein
VGTEAPKWGRSTFNKKSALSLLHPHAGTTAIFGDELDAGFFEGGLDFAERVDTRFELPSVDVSDREQGIDQVKSIMALEYSRTFVRRAA